MLTLNIRGDLKPLQRAFVALRSKQVPFAMALALTNLAKGVEQVENDATASTFDNPTPFTKKSFAIVPATKSKPIAIVFPKDIQEAYLAPYVVGGKRSLGGKRGMIVPVDAKTNQYGNLPKGALARYKGKPGVFVGAITTKAGRRISGVWQRPVAGKVRGSRRGAASAPGHLKLLVEFTDTTEAPKDLKFYQRADAYLRRHAAHEFDAAMRIALSTARR